MSKRSQVVATLLAFLLALLLGVVILDISPTEVAQTVIIVPGNKTRIMTEIEVSSGMVINITNSFCNITSPNGTSTFISPMSIAGEYIESPYTSCVGVGIRYGDIGNITTNLTLNSIDAEGFNQSSIEMQNKFLKFHFSPSDTMRIFVNDSGEFRQILRLGWLDHFFRILISKWDNRTSMRFIKNDTNSTIIQINFTAVNRSLIYNVTMYPNSPTIRFNATMFAEDDSVSQAHYATWYPEDYWNFTHPNYTWPMVVRYYDRVLLGQDKQIRNASERINATNFNYLEFWDSTKARTKISLVATIWEWTWVSNSSDLWDNSSQRFEYFKTNLIWDDDPPSNNSASFDFTFIPEQYQNCIGSGIFNMTCEYTPYEAGIHTTNITLKYFYLNVSAPKYNGTFALSNLTWFNVSSQPPPGCTETGGCDSCLAKLNNEACDCNDECNSNICLHGICRPTSPYCGDGFCEGGETCATCSADCGICGGGLPGGGGLPPTPPSGNETAKKANFTTMEPNIVVLYMNDTTQFRIDVENTGELELNNVRITPGTSSASLRIVPSYYSFINTSEKRIFLVDATPTGLVNETVTFNISSNQIWKTISIPFVVFPAREFMNVSELIAEKNRLEQLIADTQFILNSLLVNNYDVENLINELDDADENLTEAEQMIHQERYTDAKSILDNIPIMIEDIYAAMEHLQRLAGSQFLGSGFMLILLVIMVIVSAAVFIYIIFVYKRMPGH